MTETEEYLDSLTQQRAINRKIRSMRRRALLDPRDPDGLDEEDLERLRDLEEMEP